MTDIRDPRLIWLKGLLFLLIGIFASVLLLLNAPRVRIAALLVVVVWSSCRFYYFAFYVIEHYVDPAYRFAGLFDFARYAWRRRRGASRQDRSLQQDRPQ
jgi:hypothetical protein